MNLNEIVTEETYTPYGIWKVLNEILKANGQAEIRPQMMYNYARNGMIVKGSKIFGTDLRPITRDEVVAFIERYCTKRNLTIKVTEPVNTDQTEIDIESLMDKSEG